MDIQNKISVFIGILLLLLVKINVTAGAKSEFSYERTFIIFQSVAPLDSTNKKKLLGEVRKKGVVDIWVHYKMDSYVAENRLNAFQRVQQRDAIAQLHDKLLSLMRTSNLQFRVTNKMKSIPKIAMFADEQTLDYLFKSSLVKKIEKVELGKTQSF